jgi:histone acetyltransferase (RNA polymerase elongator complex component)
MSIRGREGRHAATKLKFEQELTDFIVNTRFWPVSCNREINAYGSTLYVRHIYTDTLGDILYIARIHIRAENQHQGLFTHTLNIAERTAQSENYAKIVVENVQSERLGDFLRRRGYKAIREDDGGTTSFVLLLTSTDNK